MEKCILEAKGLKKIFPDGENFIQAIRDFNYSFPRRGVFCFTGKSGSGKTTLLHMLSMLEKPDEGEVLLEGAPLYQKDSSKHDTRFSETFGYVFQEGNLLEGKTVKENMLLASDDEKKALEALERFGLKGKYDCVVGRLSGGEKQRIAIARAFLKEASILIFDEPTANLDSKNSEEVFEAIKSASRDALCLVATHDGVLAERYADVRFVLEDGALKETHGEADALFGEEPSKKGKRKPGKLSWKYGFSLLFRHKGKSIAMAALSVVSLFFVTLGGSFAFYDASSSYEQSLKVNSTWMVPLSQRVNDQRRGESYFSSRGKELLSAAKEAFSTVSPYQKWSLADHELDINVIPYFPGLKINGTTVGKPKAGEVAVSSFMSDLVGEELKLDAASIDAGRYRVGQVIPLKDYEEDLAKFKRDARLQRNEMEKYEQRYSYVVMNDEEYFGLPSRRNPFSIDASNFLVFDAHKSEAVYFQTQARFADFENEGVDLGRAPEAPQEIVVSATSCIDDPGKMIGKEIEVPDIRAFENVKGRTSFNIHDVLPRVKVVGVTKDAKADFFLAKETFSLLSEEHFASSAHAFAFVDEPSAIARSLASKRFSPETRSLQKVERFSNDVILISHIFIVLEIVFCLIASCVGFLIGNDVATGKNKEMGLLMTLGFDGKRLSLRCFLSASLFLLALLPLSFGLAGFGVFALNGIFGNPLLYDVPFSLIGFSFEGALLSFVLPLVASAASAFGAFFRLSKLQISDIYRGRE